MSPLGHCAQNLVIYEIDLVLLLLLLIFCDILLSYCLVFIRTITAPGIPVHRNIYIIKAGEIIFFIFINNYLLLYFLNSEIFSFTNVLLILTITAAAAVTKIYIIVALAGTGFFYFF